MKFLPLEMNKPVELQWKLTADPNMSNLNNWNRMVSTKNKFSEFKSTWAIVLKQLFASGSVIIVEQPPQLYIRDYSTIVIWPLQIIVY